IAKRRALGKIETERNSGKHALVADRQWLNRRGRPLHEGTERDDLSGGGFHIKLVDGFEIGKLSGHYFHDQFVGINLSEILRDLALSERIIQGIVDHLRLYPETRRLVAIDHERRRGAPHLLVRREVSKHRQSAELVQDLWSPGIKFIQVGVL